MKRPRVSGDDAVFLLAFGAFALALLLSFVGVLPIRSTPEPDPTPSGIWAGLVDDLPSGRTVECVFARDPSGSVAVTCDWVNAVRARP